MIVMLHFKKMLQRLKMFVYLHDIDCEEGHPTEVTFIHYLNTNTIQ